MAGPTPIAATHRLTVFYTVQLFQHAQRHLVNAVAGSGTSGWDLLPRPGFSAVDTDAAAQALGAVMAPYVYVGGSFDGYLLEKLVTGSYIPVISGSISATPSATPFSAAYGYIISGKDDTNRSIQIPVFEGAFSTASKFSNFASLPTTDKHYSRFFFNNDSTADNTYAWSWKRSRSSGNMQRWLAVVIDTNEKLRRKRHIK